MIKISIGYLVKGRLLTIPKTIIFHSYPVLSRVYIFANEASPQEKWGWSDPQEKWGWSDHICFHRYVLNE
jgi:hypothetical protein